MQIRPTSFVTPARLVDAVERPPGRDVAAAAGPVDRVDVSNAARRPAAAAVEVHAGQDPRLPLAAAMRAIHDRVLGHDPATR